MTAEEREARLEDLSFNQKRRLACETAEERETRLGNLRFNKQRRLACETAEERDTRLGDVRLNQQRRLECETAEERETRLREMSANQQRKLASETTEDRSARLQQLRKNQQIRLSVETATQRDDRLQQNRDSHTQQRARDSQNLQFAAAHSKIAQFHSQLSNVQVAACNTCCEEFPGLNVKSVSPNSDYVECVRCSQDMHIPKLYSSDNNMNPGPVPPELQVSVYSR